MVVNHAYTYYDTYIMTDTPGQVVTSDPKKARSKKADLIVLGVLALLGLATFFYNLHHDAQTRQQHEALLNQDTPKVAPVVTAPTASETQTIKDLATLNNGQIISISADTLVAKDLSSNKTLTFKLNDQTKYEKGIDGVDGKKGEAAAGQKVIISYSSATNLAGSVWYFP